MPVKTIDDLIADGVEGRHVLVRADLNVPLKDGEITDPGRIDASVPTLRRLLDAGARVIVAAHLGRPKGEANPDFSLAPVAEALSERLEQWVPLAADVTGEDAHERANGLNDGDILLLENVRFDARETSKDAAERQAFAAELAALTAENGAYVSDGFGVVHRAQASVYDVATLLPHYAGGLVESELAVLRRVSETPEKPYVVVLGGSKVSDKLAVIEALAPKVDHLVIGGGMCFTFLAAQGRSVGTSLLQEDMVDTCRDLLDRYGDAIVLPTDVVVAPAFAANATPSTVAVDAIPDDQMGLDIGPESVTAFGDVLRSAKTVFWNGPMGVFEFPAFAAGTKAVAQALSDGDMFSVIGGGDSAAAVRTLGFDESTFSHISTGGGASLELLEGKTLPGIAVLED